MMRRTEIFASMIGGVMLLLSSGLTAATDEPAQLWWDVMRGLNHETGAVSEQLEPFDQSYVKVPGWAVPLDSDSPMTVKEFVLVPGFGMCVHVPPPPPNQMVYVTLPEAVDFRELLGPLWIKGDIEIKESESKFGAASFTMIASDIEPYKQQR